MKEIAIKECSVEEAMAQVDALEGLNGKEKSCLRLLTEEMFSMIRELLKTSQPDYEIRREDRKYTLCVSTRARINDEARQHFLSLSSDGRNAEHRGIMGVLRWMADALTSDDTPASYLMSCPEGLCGAINEYAQLWTLSQYMDVTRANAAGENWDGMEKSIIASFADDVAIGIRNNRLEMIVTKAFVL